MEIDLCDTLFQQLRKVFGKAKKSSTLEESLFHFHQIFSLFSQLKKAFETLEKRLTEARSEIEKTKLQHQENEKQLQATSSYLKKVLTNISQGVLFINTKGLIILCNEVAALILGVETEKILQKNFWTFFKDNLFGFSLRHNLHVQSSKKTNYFTFTREGKEKKEIEISTTYVSCVSQSQQGLMILLRDLTPTHQLEMLLTQKNRMMELGEMSTMMAHDIQNLLGKTRGYSSLLFRGLEKTPHLQEMASHLIASSKDLERIISHVLQFSKPIETHFAICDLIPLIKEVIKHIRKDPSYPSHVKVQTHFSKEKFEVSIDKQLIRSALLNLFCFTFQLIETEKGAITLSLIQNSDNYLICLSSTGKGIEESHLKNIFSPLSTIKELENLSLAEAYKIIQAHYGTIDIRSQKNMGMTFTITLPMKN